MRDIFQQIKNSFSARFNLTLDQASDIEIDGNIRAGVELAGATAWILIFAIFLASIGLNVNSTAVIIGAMLISPLMGPIMGIGYGVSIYDFALIKKSLLNLGVATLISLVTASCYFLISPLGEAQSELFARTTPTIWDVLIALFGGLAGMIGASRKEKSNVIPGVAIATALMPPLCTAGFGLAHGNWPFFLGALYLFAINCVFIAVSTTIVCGFLHLPQRNFVDKTVEKRVKRLLYVIVALTTLPSFYLAYFMVQDAVFKSRASGFVQHEFQFKNTYVVDTQILPGKRRIEVTLMGNHLDRSALSELESKMGREGLAGTTLVVRQGSEDKIDLAALKEGMLSDLYQKSIQSLSSKDQTIQQLEDALTALQSNQTMYADILREFKAQYPHIERVWVGTGQALSGTQETYAPILLIQGKQSISAAERKKITRWLQVRSKLDNAQVIVY